MKSRAHVFTRQEMLRNCLVGSGRDHWQVWLAWQVLLLGQPLEPAQFW